MVLKMDLVESSTVVIGIPYIKLIISVYATLRADRRQNQAVFFLHLAVGDLVKDAALALERVGQHTLVANYFQPIILLQIVRRETGARHNPSAVNREGFGAAVANGID